jgi:hypothetical protein
MTKRYFSGPRALLILSIVVLVIAEAALASLEPSQTRTSVDHDKRVREFVEAFNGRNIDRMLELVDEDIQWLSVNGAEISVETQGKATLREHMAGYFKSCPSCKSSLEWVQKAGTRITAMERASWMSKTGPKSQSSLSVYEFSGDKIRRVYYFPAERDTPAPKNP